MAKFVAANGFWLWLLDKLGCDGLTMPWKTIYLRPDYINDAGLRAHEWVHIGQIDRHGAVVFSVLYIYYLARFGYWSSPFEIEAYAVQADVERRIAGHTV